MVKGGFGDINVSNSPVDVPEVLIVVEVLVVVIATNIYIVLYYMPGIVLSGSRINSSNPHEL